MISNRRDGPIKPWLVAGMALSFMVACGDSDSAGTPAPAHIDNPTSEEQLTTIRLTQQASERIGIELATAETRALPQRRTLGAEMMAPPGSSFLISAPRAATVLAPNNGSVPVAGSRVVRGQQLFRLAVLPDGAGLSSLQEGIAVARARHANALAKANRTERLVRAGVASASEYEDARAELASAEAALATAQGRLALLENNDVPDESVSMTLQSPGSGYVQSVHVSVGQVVVDGTSLMEIVKTSPLWVRIPVYVGDLASIDRQATARIMRLGQPAGTQGEPAYPISGPPTADPSNSSADIFYRLDNAAGIFRPGERVGAQLTIAGSNEQLVIPWSAVLHDINGGTWVYEVLAENTFARRRVELTSVVENFATIARGLAAGATVVAIGAAELFSTEFGTSH